jgi:hypothetical protein
MLINIHLIMNERQISKVILNSDVDTKKKEKSSSFLKLNS